MDSATPWPRSRSQPAAVALPLGAWLGTVSAAGVLTAYSTTTGQGPSLARPEALFVLLVVQGLSLLATRACLRAARVGLLEEPRDRGPEGFGSPHHRTPRAEEAIDARPETTTFAGEGPQAVPLPRRLRWALWQRVQTLGRFLRRNPPMVGMAVGMQATPALLLWPALRTLHDGRGITASVAIFALGALAVLLETSAGIRAPRSRKTPTDPRDRCDVSNAADTAGPADAGHEGVGAPPDTSGGAVHGTLPEEWQPPAESDSIEESEEEFDPQLLQRIERRRTDEGGQCVEALLSLDFLPGQTLHLVHLPLQPPLDAPPTVEAFPLSDGFECRVRRVVPYGVALEVRRSQRVAEPATTRLAVHMSTTAVRLGSRR